MTKPTFAALIPNYNDSAQIGTALTCVLEQTVAFDEIIIIDDASTDGSVQVIKALIKDIPQAKLYRNEKNLGVVETLNKGFALAQSEYVQMVSANDIYYNCIVEYGYKMASAYPGVAMISANTAVWDAVRNCAGEDMKMRLPQMEAFISPQEYAGRNKAAPVSMNSGSNTIRREAYLALGGQEKELKWYADWFLYFLIGFTYGFAYVPQLYSVYRMEGEKSFSKGIGDPRERTRITLKMLDMLHDRYPQQAAIFKEAAILPRYSLRIFMALLDRRYRWFITPLLAWRCLGHQCAFWLKKILPRHALMHLRRLLRL